MVRPVGRFSTEVVGVRVHSGHRDVSCLRVVSGYSNTYSSRIRGIGRQQICSARLRAGEAAPTHAIDVAVHGRDLLLEFQQCLVLTKRVFLCLHLDYLFEEIFGSSDNPTDGLLFQLFEIGVFYGYVAL